MADRRTYDDEALASAVLAAHSWRGVLRSLGLRATSAGAMRCARRHADRLDLDYSHFTGQRRWSDQALRDAITRCVKWAEVAEALGLAGGANTSTLKGHALRLGIDTRHLDRYRHQEPATTDAPNRRNLSRAGTMLAAAWFELAGSSVSWPLEPTRYDLLAWHGGRPQRIQVKTTTRRVGSSHVVSISDSGSTRSAYDPDEIDQFFVVDGELNFYLIPIGAVGGLTSLQLSAYVQFRLAPF